MTTNSTDEAGQTRTNPAAAKPEKPASPWRAFHHRTFTVVWIAAVVSNVGLWMYGAASGWLMTGLTPNPVAVAMVQVAHGASAKGQWGRPSHYFLAAGMMAAISQRY